MSFKSLLFFAINSQNFVVSKKCSGEFSSKQGVTNLCQGHFPDASSDKIWFIKFYAPWCGHCKSMQPAWKQLGQAMKDDPQIKIGAIDCDNQDNKGICGQYGVQGFPTIKTIINGKAKAYNGAREYEPLKQHILKIKDKRGSKGGSAKCLKGIFKSSLKDSVLPLCSKHYPDDKSKNSWVMAFYNKEEFSKHSDSFNRLALEFGNEPADKNKQRKRIEKQSVRVSEAIEKYNVKGFQPSKSAGKSKDPLAKFGAICCDCEKDKVDEKCQGLTLPHFRILNAKSKKNHDYSGENFDMDKFASFTLEKLGLIDEEKSDSDKAKKSEL